MRNINDEKIKYLVLSLKQEYETKPSEISYTVI